MSQDAQKLITDLFKRLQDAEEKSGIRDDMAEAQINRLLVQQPAAPYYMAQTIIMQEAALKQLNAKIELLEKQLADSTPSSSGRFLSGLFDDHSESQPRTHSGWSNPAPKQSPSTDTPPKTSGANQPYYNRSGRGSFLGGALQTAAGVAGGMVVGNMFMNMFGHHTPTEMVDIIEQPTSYEDSTAYTDSQENNDSTFNQSDMNQANWDNDMQQDEGMDFDSGFDDFDDFT